MDRDGDLDLLVTHLMNLCRFMRIAAKPGMQF